MKTLAERCFAGVVGVILVGCLSASWAQSGSQVSAQNPKIGKIKKIEGKAQILPPGATAPRSAQAGDWIRVRDRLETLQASKAWWSFHPFSPDKNDASLGENSQLEFSGFERERGSSSVSLGVSAGIVRFIKLLPKSSRESSFTVAAPAALAWVDTPQETADFVVESLDPRKTQITVIRGTVKVRNISAAITTVRTVRACQMVTVEEIKEPSRPTVASGWK